MAQNYEMICAVPDTREYSTLCSSSGTDFSQFLAVFWLKQIVNLALPAREIPGNLLRRQREIEQNIVYPKGLNFLLCSSENQQ
jgi:hypothetical protein